MHLKKILDHKSHWIYPNELQTHVNKIYIFLDQKFERQSYSYKNVKTTTSFTYARKRVILSKLSR